MSECRHEHTTVTDGMSAHADPPYSLGDFWWLEFCDSCGETVREGDGYDHPKRRSDPGR